ncbi:putative zinc-binding oxidoreductase ToxD [Rhexocercosporidium sp. MPI-PUGE-AT-0058]|nr:putative zinc-binding oxidoreductase ToxD [Rhexocercosporidium sp. MPI-PUGE-AT-0058]
MEAAPSNRGLLKIGQGKSTVAPIPIPSVPDDSILVKTVAVALNPTDWQTLDEVPAPGFSHSLLGVDAAGIVVEIGKGVTKDFKIGDRVAGFSHGGNDRNPVTGTFANYILMKGDVSLHIPPSMSFEDAATLPCGIGTVGLAFYRHLELPTLTFPVEEKSGGPGPYILIYGGSSATGSLAIQFAKLSGLTVITTASPRNFDFVKSLGADHVLDYHDPEVGSKINALTSNTLHLVLDTIAVPSSSSICAAALSTSPSPDTKLLYVTLLPIAMSRPEVKNIFFLAYTISGEEFEIEGEVWPASPEDNSLARVFIGLFDGLLREGRIKTHPVGLREGGLEGILGGMMEMKEGKVSGQKLVYRISDEQ